MKEKNIQIAIDGYAGCGKSTLAKNVADAVGLVYIPSGIIYRFVTLRLMEADISATDVKEEDLLFVNDILFANNHQIVDSVGSVDMTNLNIKEIRQNVAYYAKNMMIRNAVTNYIRALKKDCSAVVEGRDIGSIVLPNADLKYFLHGSIDYRIQCWEKGQIAKYGSFDQKERDLLYHDTIIRDKIDETRESDPLICASDAIRIDVEQLHGTKLFEKVVSDIYALKQ